MSKKTLATVGGTSLRAMLFLVVLLFLSACGDDNVATSGAEDQTATPTSEGVETRPQATRPHSTGEASPIRYLRRQQHSGRPHQRLTEAAQELLPAEIAVWCWSEEVWTRAVELVNGERRGDEERFFAGLADFYAFEIHLDGRVCEELEDLGRRADEESEIALADALGVFVHETRHFSQTGSNEAATECKALQHMAATAAVLGVSEERGSELARLYWQELYPTLPPAYRSQECRPRGALDDEPDDPTFP